MGPQGTQLWSSSLSSAALWIASLWVAWGLADGPELQVGGSPVDFIWAPLVSVGLWGSYVVSGWLALAAGLGEGGLT